MNEKGFASIAALCMLAVMIFFAGALLQLNLREKETVEDLFSGMQAQALARDGMEQALVRLNQDKELCAKAEQAPVFSPALEIFAGEERAEKSCRVYLIYSEQRYVLMSAARVGRQRGQVFVYIEPADDGSGQVRWER